MADWYGTARSNYFRVTDIEKFKELCSLWGIEFIRGTKPMCGVEEVDPGLVGFACGNGGLPNNRAASEDEGSGLELDFEAFLQELSGHLGEGEVAVMMEVGNEKLRYMTGIAYAINSRGEQATVSLYSIYELAERLGKNVTKAEY